MSNGNPNIAVYGQNTQFSPGVSGNPNGLPKGYKRISTWVKELVNDEEFEAVIKIGEEIKEFKGAPMKAIVQAQIVRAISGDTRAAELIMKVYAIDDIPDDDGPAKTIIETRKRMDAAAQIIEGEVVETKKDDDFGMEPADRPDSDDDKDDLDDTIDDINDADDAPGGSQNAGVIEKHDTTDDITELTPADD